MSGPLPVSLPGTGMNGFGKAEAGLLGAVRYWLRVRKRLQEIEGALAAAAAEEAAAQTRNDRAAAALGREVHRLGATSEGGATATEEALAAEEALRRAEADAAEKSAALEREAAVLLDALSEAETAAAPHRETLSLIQGEQRELATRRRGCETNRKRYRIELENTESLLAQKRQSQVDGRGQTDTLLSEIETLSGRRDAAKERLAALDAESRELDASSAAVADREAAAAEIAAPFINKCDAIRAVQTELEARGAAAKIEAERAMEAEAARAEAAWIEAGRAALQDRVRRPELEGMMTAAVASARQLSTAMAETEALRLASEGYDRRAVRRGKTVLVAGAIALVVVVAALVILF